MSVDQYNSKLNTYIISMTQRQYLFEITKCCDYSEFIPTYKTNSLADLYKTVLNQFCHTEDMNVELFVRQHNSMDKLIIPNKRINTFDTLKQKYKCDNSISNLYDSIFTNVLNLKKITHG